MSGAIEPLSSSNPSDSDSGYDETQTLTESIKSSIYAYEQENGRTYHAYKSGKYVMPNDEGEQDRMDSECYTNNLLLKSTLNHYSISPLSCPQVDSRV